MVNRIKELILERIRDLENQRETMKKYLLMKNGTSDLHAVADAAMDMREMNAGILELDKVLENIRDLENSERKD